jgi:hypothetical protein
MEVGQRFVIHLPIPGAEPVSKLCRVVHLTLSNNRYLIGAEFTPFPKRGNDKGLTKRIRKWLGVEA